VLPYVDDSGTEQGAEWIWNLADLHFPGAIQIVDLYHARQHLWELARKLRPNEAVKPKAWMMKHQRMRDPKFRRQHWFAGSGVIEAGCKTVIGPPPQAVRHVLERPRAALTCPRCYAHAEFAFSAAQVERKRVTTPFW